MWTKAKEGCEVVAHLATIAGVAILAWQVNDAAKEVTKSLDAARVDRSAEWVTRLVEPENWQKMVATSLYLADPKIDTIAKLRKIGEDMTLQSDLFHTLAELELLGYMYNTDKIDGELIRRGPSAAIQQYYQAAKFWIDENRRETGDSTFQRELELMVQDLQEPS
jgi:hypothetical protein